MDLFEYAARECDHLPVCQREYRGEWLICGRCGKQLRTKTYQGDDNDK